MTPLEFAILAHDGQRRPHGVDEPYILHPVRVSNLLHAAGEAKDTITAGLLHDVVEDTNKTPNEIEALFGSEVEKLVEQVTKVSLPADGNRATRFAMDLKHFASGSPGAQSIKLADIADNMSDITAMDPDFAKIYVKERAALLMALNKGSSKLYRVAARRVFRAQNYLDSKEKGE